MLVYQGPNIIKGLCAKYAHGEQSRRTPHFQDLVWEWKLTENLKPVAKVLSLKFTGVLVESDNDSGPSKKSQGKQKEDRDQLEREVDWIRAQSLSTGFVDVVRSKQIIMNMSVSDLAEELDVTEADINKVYVGFVGLMTLDWKRARLNLHMKPTD